MSIGSATRAIGAASSSPLPIPWTKSTDSTGYTSIVELPATLASKAALPVDDLSLAACVASEVGSLPGQYQYAVGEAIANEASANNMTLTSLLAGSGKAPGHYGQQSGRYAATTQPPSFRNLVAARLARQNAGARFTKGARRFLDLKVQDGGIQAGKPIQPSENVIRSRYNDGWKWVGPLHDPDTGEWLIDSYILFLMSRDGKYTLDDSLAELNEGRKRWKFGGTVANIVPTNGGGVGLILLAGAIFAAAKELL